MVVNRRPPLAVRVIKGVGNAFATVPPLSFSFNLYSIELFNYNINNCRDLTRPSFGSTTKHRVCSYKTRMRPSLLLILRAFFFFFLHHPVDKSPSQSLFKDSALARVTDLHENAV